MASLKPPTPSVPKPKSASPLPPKSGQPPKPPSPYANPPFKPFPAIKPFFQVGGLPGGLAKFFAKQPAAKAMPSIEQLVADFQKQRMADIRRVEAAVQADKRAQVSARRGLS